jgi:diguanylate cyclase (GGDEF)-like protein/PAS domain S-box-containing protein
VPDVDLWVPLLLFGSGVYLLLALGLLRRRYGPGTRPLGLGMLCVSVWTIAAVAEWTAGSPEAALLFTKVKYTGIALVSPLILLFFVQYFERPLLRRVHVAALLAVPVATIAVTWSNDTHAWMWASSAVPVAGGWDMRDHWGPWFWRVHLPYSYLLMTLSFVLLAIEGWRGSKLYRAQVALLFVATLLPVVVNVLFTLGYFPGDFGPTPLALAISSLLYAWGFLRLQLFQRSTIAYHAVFEQMQDAVIVVDAYDRVVDLNSAASHLCGREGSRDAVGYRVEELLPQAPALLEALRASGSVAAACEDANGRRLEVTVSPIRVASGSLRGRVILLRDVTERQRAETALRRSEALVRSLVDVSPNGILRLRPKRDESGEVRDFVCLFANPAAASWIGRTQTELVGKPFKDAVHPHTPVLFQAFRDVLRSGEACDLERALVRHGSEIWLRFLAVPTGGDLLVTCVDITETKQRERKMEEAAYQDPLTGLMNRRGLEADAAELLAGASARMERGALLYVDLDDFKRVNDSLGHEAGDLLLCELAARLRQCTRGPDLLARIGGDEFVLLVTDVDAAGAREVADRVSVAIRTPVTIDGADVSCSASIGIALHPDDGKDLKSLIQGADQAMYRAKATGSGIAKTCVEQDGDRPDGDGQR